MKEQNLIISSNSSWNIINFRKNLISSFLDKNYKVYILVPNNDKYTRLLKDIGCKVEIIKFKSRDKSLINAIKLYFKYFYFFYKIKPDYYFSFTIKPNIIGTLASMFFSVKVINNITGLGSVFINDGYLKKIIIIFYKLIFFKTTIVFFQNNYDLNFFIKNNLLNSKKAKLLPGSGINLNTFKYKKPLNKINKNYNFTFFGRVISEKGILELIDAIKIVKKKYSNINFFIIGDTDINDKKYYIIDELISNQDKLFIYLPHQENIFTYLNKSDCVILPSYREGMPRTLLESAALGVPIMASNVPGCNEFIENKVNGLLFDVKNSKDLAKTIMSFISLDYETLLKYSFNARDKIEKEFDEKFIIKKYNDIIDYNE